MKTLKTLLAISFFLITLPGYSQFYSAGLQMSAISGYPVIRNLGLHATTDYMIDRRYGIIGSVGYYLPRNYSSTRTLYGKNGMSVTPNSVTVATSDQVTGWQIALMGKYYFVKGYKRKGFSLYGLAGIGAASFSIKEKLGSYNESKYGQYSRHDYENEKTTNFIYNLGLGFEVQMDKGTVYFEPVINIPVDHDEIVLLEMPYTFQYSLGYRFFFGK